MTMPRARPCAARSAASAHVVYAPSTPSGHLDVDGQLPRRSASCAGWWSRWPGSTPAPKLFVVTRNAQPIADGDRANPAHAVLWGQGRTLALEHPEFWGGVIDVDDTVPPELLARYLQAEAT